MQFGCSVGSRQLFIYFFNVYYHRGVLMYPWSLT
jgi:hypothetical protein